MIVGCIGSAVWLRRCAKKIPADCDWVEVRLDLTGLCGGKWIALCAAIQKQGLPVLLTIRSHREGGEWRGRETERLALYLAGLKSVSAVDVEIGSGALEVLAQVAHKRGVKVVGSFHDFNGTPDLARLEAVEVRGRALGADVVKIAAMVKAPRDLARLFALPAQAQGPICVLGMGGRGGDIPSRVALRGLLSGLWRAGQGHGTRTVELSGFGQGIGPLGGTEVGFFRILLRRAPIVARVAGKPNNLCILN